MPPGVSVLLDGEGFMVVRHTRQGFLVSCRREVWLEDSTLARKERVWAAIWRVVMKKKDKKLLTSLNQHASTYGLAEQFPNLSVFMTTAQYEDEGGRREAPSITFWCDNGLWKASVKDKDEGLVMWLSAETVVELLQCVELYCLESEAPWRHDVYGSGNKGKRVERK